MTDRHMAFPSMSAIVDFDRHEKRQKMQCHYVLMLFAVPQKFQDKFFFYCSSVWLETEKYFIEN